MFEEVSSTCIIDSHTCSIGAIFDIDMFHADALTEVEV